MFRRLSKAYHKLLGYGLCENVNSSQFDMNCLFVYVAAPFQSKTISFNHQNQWQAKELARIVGEFDYNVDVINYDEKVHLDKAYDLVIDVHPGLNTSYQRNMSAHCRKIAYITGSNPAFSNLAEAQRLESLFDRKRVRLKQRRFAKAFDKGVMDHFDAMFFLGNSYNLRTYDEFNLKKHFIQNTGVCPFENDDFSKKSPRNFLFLASCGQVHKGLDLLLDVFSRNADLNLYVCSSFKSERDFCTAYHRELYRSKNIHPVGFVSIESDRFREICRQCTYVVLPSCSEANAGSILTAMAAGLIPLVSRECGFAEDEVHYLDDCSIDSITETLRFFAGKSQEWREHESVKASQMVNERYSPSNYSASIRNALRQVIGGYPL